MKTPEEILDEIAAENMINIQQMVTTKQLAILAMRRYAKLYHESEVKKLNIPDVVGRSEQLKAFADYVQGRMWEGEDKDLSEFVEEFLSL